MNNPPHVLSLYVYSSTGRHVYTGYKTNAIVRRKRDNRIDHRLVQAISNKLFKIRKSTTCFRDNLEILHTCSVTPCRPGGGFSFFSTYLVFLFNLGLQRRFGNMCKRVGNGRRDLQPRSVFRRFQKRMQTSKNPELLSPFRPFGRLG